MRELGFLSFAALLASPPARAAEPGEPVRIEILDNAGCTNKDAFMAAVRARSARIREAETGEAARGFRVAVSATSDGSYRGELTVVDADSEGPWGRSRSIEGKSCQEVVDALAVFTVLAVDPTAVMGENVPEPASELPATPPPLPLVPTERPPEKSKPPPPRQHTESRDSQTRFRSVAGLNAGIFAAGAAALLPAGGLFTEFGLDDSPDPGVSFSPSARISLTVTGLAKVSVPEGSAGLRWTKLGLDVCPFVFRITTSLAVRPCLTLSEGLLNASGHIAAPKSVTAPFQTAGALARGEWAISSKWLVELTGGVELPLRKDQFYFEPSTVVYEVPPVVGVVTVGGGYRFL